MQIPGRAGIVADTLQYRNAICTRTDDIALQHAIENESHVALH